MADLQCLRRQLSVQLSGSAVYAALTENGQKPNTLLLETADSNGIDNGKSLAFVSSCMAVSGCGDRVMLQALNQNGRHLLRHFLAQTSYPYEEGHDCATLRIPAVDVDLDEMERLKNDKSYRVLRELLSSVAIDNDDDKSVLQLVGGFAFEAIENYEQFAPLMTKREQGDFYLLIPDVMVAIPRRGGAQISAVVFAGERSAHVLNDMSRQVADMTEKLASVIEPHTLPVNARFTRDDYRVSVSDEAFCQHVKQAKEYLYAGDAFQIVISRQFELPCPQPFFAYRILKQSNPSPYLFYANFGEQILLGASPESAVKVEASTRQVEVLPIAGTRTRGRDQNGAIDLDLDARLEAELRLDNKEVAEHMMLVDLARNDVARVAQHGTRYVADLLKVERYARVMHLVSRVRATLKTELHALHALAASMPMGTLSGAPKIRAIEIIRQIENKERGFYGGAVGYINARGDLDSAIVIRSAVIKRGTAVVQAGAGVVLASDPQAEADETTRKAEAVLRAIVASNALNGVQHDAVS